MPAPIPNAVCGPQVPGTKRPANMADLVNLNSCPLKTCCNVWGQCGITKDFCIPSAADTGAPGTAKPGSNGCIASCGMDIVINAQPPANFMRVGYFDAWNLDRPCLHMLPGQIDIKYYTHLHFAFGGITENFEVDMSAFQDTFNQFKALKSVKRILSFGGWSFSTEHDTFPIFRKGVTPAQRLRFANNVAAFILNQGLDGVDFDWEYPGAPDIPGIPAGSPEDGANYLEFLKLVRVALPVAKTIGIAAPASFWYLRGFPIAEMAKSVDYIIYMTYDLHGQWDYGNKYSTEGCPARDCLRSHVNRTETEYSLSMITKAGVPANKIIIGMALYGRSFQMTRAGCYGPDCTYTGLTAGAAPGRCTKVRGYLSNFEIREIIAERSDVQQYSDKEGDILVYDQVQWVSWMTRNTYDDRVKWITSLNFGGTTDWAIDLDADYSTGDGPGGGDSGSGPVFISPDIYKTVNPVVECFPPCTFIFPPWVLSTTTTITIPPATVSYEENWATTMTISGAVITTFAASLTSTVITVPPITTTAIELWNIVWTGDESGNNDEVFIWLTSNVSIPPITITQTKTSGITRPPITWTYNPGSYPTLAPERDPENPEAPRPITIAPPGTTAPPAITTPSRTTRSPFPPPPPPDNFPSRERVTRGRGSPKPTCRPGQICGKKCLINCNPFHLGCFPICGCIGLFCPSGSCIGPGCYRGGGGGGGGGDGDQPSSCRTSTTVSFCKVDCSVLQYPGSTTTSCMEKKCTSTITACKATGSTTTSTTTMGCAPIVQEPILDPNALVPILGDGVFGGHIINLDEFSTMPLPPRTITVATTPVATKPATTTANNPPQPTVNPEEPPIPTPPVTGRPYCFRDHNGDRRWNAFTEDDGDGLIKTLCSVAESLPPSNTFGHAFRGKSGLLASVTWARDQSGCSPKSNLPLGAYCRDTFRHIIFSCDDFNPKEAYGGAFMDNDIYRCVTWWFASDSRALLQQSTQAEGPKSLIQAEQEALQAMLSALEPELPRLEREL